MMAPTRATLVTRTILLPGLACMAASAFAGAFDEVIKMQKNGMWEITTEDAKEKARLYCVTEQDKLDVRKTMETVFKGCKTVRDTFSGGRFEIQLQCSKPAMLSTTTGTATPVEISQTATIKATGNNPEERALIQYLGQEGKPIFQRQRWIRACRSDEKPGMQ